MTASTVRWARSLGALAWTLISIAPGTRALDHLELDVAIDPERQHLEIVATYSIPAEGAPETLGFYLNQAFQITAVEGVESYTFEHGDSFLDFVGKRLEIVPKTAASGGDLNFTVRYGGQIPAAFQDAWLEFVVDLLWFPIHESLGRVMTAETHVSLPEDYVVFGRGQVARDKDGWLISMEDPTGDVNWIASPALEVETFQLDAETVRVAGLNLADGPAPLVADQVAWALRWYNESLGASDPKHELSIILRPQDVLSGYARPGYIAVHVADDFESSSEEYFQLFAHEAAHLWWFRGSPVSFENWLNESFAEYSSLLAVRASGNTEGFERILAGKRSNLGALPPVIGLERTDPASEAVLYNKGCVLLHDLELKIGEEPFLRWLARVVAEKVSTTDELIQLLDAAHGEAVATWFAEKLQS